jgi:hypothetical protein
MLYQCLGCGKTYGHKTGLNNHRRACDRWKNLDRVAKHKRRRLEMQNLGAESGQMPSQMPGPAQDDFPIEVCNEYKLSLFDCSLSYRIQSNVIMIRASDLWETIMLHLGLLPPWQLPHGHLHDLDVAYAFHGGSMTIYLGCGQKPWHTYLLLPRRLGISTPHKQLQILLAWVKPLDLTLLATSVLLTTQRQLVTLDLTLAQLATSVLLTIQCQC